MVNSAKTGLRAGGFAPQYWGAATWKAMHFIAAAYPSKPSAAHKKHAKAFFVSLQYLLPCVFCQQHYREITTKGPLRIQDSVFGSRLALFKWLSDVHDRVSADTHKNRSPKDWKTWYRQYDALRSG
jgi:hypothetical protein